MKREELVKIATELNTVMSLDPAINTKAKDQVLIDKIMEAGEMIDPDLDDFSKPTIRGLKELGAWPSSEPAGEEGDLDEELEEEIEPEEEIEEEIEEEPEPVPVPKKGKKGESPAPTAKKEPAPTSVVKKTKKTVVLEMISKKEGATIDQIAAQIVAEQIDPDLEKNKTTVKLWLSKLGHDTKKTTIEKNPVFKIKK